MDQVKTKHLTKIAFKTLGCKLNFTETEQIAKKFSFKRYKRVNPNEIADIYVFNTCSVTENADKKFKNVLNHGLENVLNFCPRRAQTRGLV